MSKLIALGAAAVVGAASLCPICGHGIGAAAAATGSSAVQTDTARVRLAIRGMTCGSCATTARIALERIAGVYQARVSYDSASAVVLYDPARTSPEVFMARLTELTGYQTSLESATEPARDSS